jgi:hypothetical protein
METMEAAVQATVQATLPWELGKPWEPGVQQVVQ